MTTIREEGSGHTDSAQGGSLSSLDDGCGILSTIDLCNALTAVQMEPILQDVFDLFGINTFDVDFDANLILRKLRYVYSEKPPIDREKRRVRFEVECLEEANKVIMEYISDSRNKFHILEKNPLAKKQRYHATPNEFLVILTDIREARES